MTRVSGSVKIHDQFPEVTSLQEIHLSSEHLSPRHQTVQINATGISGCVPSNLMDSGRLVFIYERRDFRAQRAEYFQRNERGIGNAELNR